MDFLGMLRMQGLVEQFASQFAAMTNNPNLKPPADMPKEPAFIGASITANAPASFEFHVVVPGAVGPVVEKGLVPMFQSLKPPGN